MRPNLIQSLILTLSTLISITTTQSLNPKRGLAYHTPGHRGEYDIFFAQNSSITWYYNWGPYPSNSAPTSNIDFLPLIHGISDIEDTIATIQRIPRRQQHTHILTFNEPDGSTSSGGSDIDPYAAANAYIRYIVPLRASYQISHPVTTGSGNGLNWLRNFNASCWEIAPSTGCPSDFIAAHHYGDFPALASWLGTLHEFYGSDKKIYLTEFALPQTNMAENLRMMNQSLTYLDSLEYVAGYAWFGMFRTTEANAWTGPGVSLLDGDGGLTSLGSLYLGGSERGFGIGRKSATSDALPGPASTDAAGRKELLSMVVAIAVAVVLWSSTT